MALCLIAPLHAAAFQADFEQGAAGAPTGWTISYSEGHGIATWENEGYQSAHALAVEGTAENEFTTWVGPSFPVQPNTPYLITVMLKSRQGAGPPGLSVGGQHYYLPSVFEWTRWQMRFTTPADMTRTEVGLYLYHRPGQKVWFDDVVVAPATDVIMPLEPADNLITASVPARLSWQPSSAPYTVLISRDETFAQIAHHLTVTETSVQPPALAPGLWHWMVTPAVESLPLEKQLRQIAEVRSFLVTGPLQQTRRDTTPPFISHLTPRRDASVGQRVTISAEIADAGGLAQAELLLDGQRAPRARLSTGTPATLTATARLVLGKYQATVVATDQAGNVSRESWSIYVGVTARLRYGFGKDLHLYRDGTEPLFPIGIYDYDDFKHLDELANAGFTYIITGGPSGKVEMDATHAAGLKIVIGVDVARKAKTLAEAKNMLQTGALVNMLHPALLGYWTDEIEGETFDPDFVADVQTAVKQFDPDHPFIACIAGPQQYAAFGQNADVLWPDVYPVPRDPMTAISTVMDKAVANQQGRKPVWFLAQGFDWAVAATGQPEPGQPYRPTGEEMRCMSYLALNHGARGIGYWAAGNGKCAISRWPERFAELLRLVSELHVLSPMFLSKPQMVNWAMTPQGPLDVRLWQVAKKRILIVVNTSRRPQLMRVKVPRLKSGAAVKVLCEDRVVTAGKELTDVFAPLAVHVYQL